ncbi:MAG: SDR family NAD(P)-dependent oxidoreductase [Elusimicrobia bacterium]|nr:SDR family NAD(P)-dependent oxidoreductase [Elusimicrobiota bacterium]
MPKKILITGGCGFIGSNAAEHYLKRGSEVIIIDNLARKGSDTNLKWLKTKKSNVKFQNINITNYKKLTEFFKNHVDIDVILHFAGQVAVTSSLVDPRYDFETNALGTFNILEGMRNYCPDAILLYASTNKVYGSLEQLPIKEGKDNYELIKYKKGISENFALDFHSPYGCSKGAADSYIKDYSRIYNLKGIVFRQSCIYGEHQLGIEDQGWIAHFIIRAILSRPITIYGDGKQVRDVLYIKDLLEAYDKAIEKSNEIGGDVYNVGGGVQNQISILQFIHFLEDELDKKFILKFKNVRAGDQKIFVSDNSKIKNNLGWSPQTKWKSGVRRLIQWVKENQDLFKNF